MFYDEDLTREEFAAAYQELIDNGSAWRLEGSVGRTAMSLIESGDCVLGPVGHTDYWGNYVPSRTEVEPGTKGSPEYAEMQSESMPQITVDEANAEVHAMIAAQDEV